MKWHEISVYTTEEAVEAIADYFHRIGAGGVSIEESGTLNKQRDTSFGQWYELPLNDIPEGFAVMKAYFADPVDPNELLANTKQFIGSLNDYGIEPGDATVDYRVVDEEDWANAWKKYYKPVRISERITIKPTWEPYDAKPGELIIEMDPGMAFGTGTHPTTSLCLRTIEQNINTGDHVIDIGTGSGVLAIAAAKLGAERVLALDIDPVAVSSASENVRLNDLENRINVIESDLLAAIAQDDPSAADKQTADTASGANSAATRESVNLNIHIPVQLVVANILAEIILQFTDDVYRILASKGRYIVSGVIQAKADLVEEGLRKSGFSIKERLSEQDWVVIVAQKG